MPFFRLKLKCGFSLIELMVVVTLFGIAASLVTASYLSFERNQRLRGAASQLKNDLRLIQNKATSGDKGSGGLCGASSTLGGWYLGVSSDQTSYTFAGVCVTGSSETKFFEPGIGEKTVSLPAETKINRIFYTPNPDLGLPLAIFFRPLKNGVSFHDGTFALSPDFFESDGITLRNLLPTPPQGAVTIEVSNSTGDKLYNVRIEPTGEISEIKP
jgi:prepilin-type N-terminal cleavage/methylation domain-containing protein